MEHHRKDTKAFQLTKGSAIIGTGQEGGVQGWGQSTPPSLPPMNGVSKNVLAQLILSTTAEI